MGWKAAEKLIRHWKVLRGDTVKEHPDLYIYTITIIISLLCGLNGLTVFFLHLQVMIIRGKDKGDTGVVKRVVRSQNRVIVEGKNLV